MSNLKTHISLFLLLVVATYCLDLHGLAHAFENDYTDDDTQCEICILHHQHHDTSFSILPTTNYFDNHLLLENRNFQVDLTSYNFVYQNLYFEGQFYNKPPPYSI